MRLGEGSAAGLDPAFNAELPFDIFDAVKPVYHFIA
jgi:hypothetical protein